MARTLVDDLRAAGHDPSRMVLTLDALHTEHATARLLHGAGAGYAMTVKGNQPGLEAERCATEV